MCVPFIDILFGTVYLSLFWYMFSSSCIHTYRYIHTYIHTYIQTYTGTNIHTYINRHSGIHKHIRIPTYIYTYIYSHKHTYIHTYVNVCVHTYIHSYIHSYIHNVNQDMHDVMRIDSLLDRYREIHGNSLSCDPLIRCLRVWNWHRRENNNIPKHTLTTRVHSLFKVLSTGDIAEVERDRVSGLIELATRIPSEDRYRASWAEEI